MGKILFSIGVMDNNVKQSRDDFFDKVLVSFTLIFTFLILCLSSLNGAINPDEREHLTMVFNIARGEIPYLDFFEHHHPLLWYIAQPLVFIYGEQADIYIGLRIFDVLVLLVTSFYLYKIGRVCNLSCWQALWIPVFYFSFDAVLLTGIEFRPDNLMVLCFIAGFFYCIKYMQGLKRGDLFKSGILFFLSFCALQKIILFLAVVLGEFGYFLYQQKDKRKKILADLFYVAGFLCVVGLIIILGLVSAGVWKDYFELNWVLNARTTKRLVLGSAVPPVYCAGGILALGLMFCRLVPREIKFLSVLYLLFPVWNLGFRQYALPFSSFLSVLAVWSLNAVFVRWVKFLVFSLFLLCFVYQAMSRYSKYFYQHDRLLVSLYWDDIVLKHSHADDLVLSECRYPQFFGGIRRQPLEYYQFSLFDISHADYDFFKRHSFPDLNEVIYSQKPKIVVNRDWQNCRFAGMCSVMQVLDREYMEQHYINYQDRFYIRKE